MSSQTNTLFRYFNKSPRPPQGSGDGAATRPQGNGDVLAPIRSPNSGQGKGSPREGTKKKGLTGSMSMVEVATISKGDIVWAKLEGFPWWPSLVCDHPSHKTHLKGGKHAEVHVQFFDSPPSRAWIKGRNIKTFKGVNDASFQKGGPFYTLNTKIRQGAVDADKAMLLDVSERLKLVVELQLSSEEEDDEEEEDMEENKEEDKHTYKKIDFDPAIFDTEMSDDNTGTKENCSSSVKKVNMPQSKSPQKVKRKAAKEAEVRNKRRRIMKSGSTDESEEDFKPESSEDDDDDESSSGEDEDQLSDGDPDSEPESPVKKPKKKKSVPNTPATVCMKRKLAIPIDSKSTFSPSDSCKKSGSPSVSAKTKSRLSLFSAPEVSAGEDGPGKDPASFPHVGLDFLQPNKIRDLNKKPPTDPDYNPKTLFVPETFLDKQTPAMRQWWQLKTDHFDTVLFFKVGKFYELYNMDAVIGVQELGLVYMRGEFAHSGFPEIAYNRYADALIQKGYKVARVEQTETPDMMAERCRSMKKVATKFDKVVKREICQVSTQGTRSYNYLDGDSGDASNRYLLAICEKSTCLDSCSSYGVCFIDSSIGTFHIGQFDDDRHLSRLRTLISHYTPVQVLYEKGKLSMYTLQLLTSNLSSATKEALCSGSEFWDSGKTLKTLAEEDYFKFQGETKWPDVLKAMLSENDSLGLTASESQDLAVRSLGAIIWYLQYCLLDQEVLSMRKFEEYIPPDCAVPDVTEKQAPSLRQRNMVLDGVTMANLEVAWSQSNQSTEGTLLARLNHCTMASGKRLFHQWLCSPLCQPSSISDRLDAVEDLMESAAIVDECVAILKKLPDLERLLSRIHTLGSAGKGKNHPDNRAIFFEEVKYSKRKIEDFLSTLEGFKLAVKVVEKFAPLVPSFKSRLLVKCLKIATDEDDDGLFPDIADDLHYFDKSFDHKKAKQDGVIVPNKGVDKDYDQALGDIQTVEKCLADYLDQQKKVLSCRSIIYWGTSKNRYQMELPETAAKNVPDSYELMSSKKGAKRYRTAEINDFLQQLTDAEERKDSCLKDIMRRIFYTFDERHSKWMAVVQCLSVLDVLISMASYSRGGDGVTCRPEFVDSQHGTQPVLEIREGRHPCVTRTFEGGDFIPNDTLIGVTDENDNDDDSHSLGQVVLVTGPNMGGKSTLMRQVGLITIMAQMGCYVPASKCKLTPVDRIFTRLGASDRIMSGESTFFVELSETSSILQHATHHSLVLMDELGRGTATFDGTAIACSVVKELSEKIRCRSLFSTHYHSLVEEFREDSNVRLGHMACMVENDNEDDPSQETITFLYKFVKGACPKSYGFNAARLANIPEEVIRCAVKKSKQFEKLTESHRRFRSIWSAKNESQLQSLL